MALLFLLCDKTVNKEEPIMTEIDFLTKLFVAKRQLEGDGFCNTARAVGDLLIMAQADVDEKRKRNEGSKAA